MNSDTSYRTPEIEGLATVGRGVSVGSDATVGRYAL
jgi:hypothetical protein